uniref:Cnidarian restricted protein n=1 Tax=Clytia hemisphaerica TaxID=252671 RepID=A0A7M5XDH4_9CNID
MFTHLNKIQPCICILLLSIDLSQSCKAFTGPEGQIKCMKLDQYDDYQWVSCLSRGSVERISKGQYTCGNRLAKYCRYSCEIEIYGSNSGSIGPQCKCTPGQQHPTSSASSPEMSSTAHMIIIGVFLATLMITSC